MNMMEEDIIKGRLLLHLRKKNVIGAKHTHYDTLKFGFPKHLGKEIENVAKDLIRKGWLVAKPTGYGLQVSLSKDKIKDIDEFIRKTLGFNF